MKLGTKALLSSGALAAALSAGYGLRAYADGVPTMKPVFYSGTLEDDGKLASGMYSIALTLFDAESGGAALCSSEVTKAPVVSGRFRVEVSPDCVTLMQGKPDVWAGLKFTGPDGVPHELPDRSKVGAVPYAMEAQHAVSASVAKGALAAQLVPTGAVMAFDLDACPAGWSELTAARGRTLVGTNPAAGGGLSARPRGTAFGAETTALAAANLPPHAHAGSTGTAPYTGGSDPWFDYNQNGCGQGGLAVPYVRDQNCFQTNWREHTHPFTTDNGPGTSQPIAVVQPSLALLYCKKN